MIWLNKNKGPKEKVRRTKGEKVVFAIMFVILALECISILIAFGITVINSFKDPFDYALGNTWKLPDAEYGWHPENYAKIFTEFNVNGINFWGLFWNSIWQTLGPTLISMTCTIMASYAYSRFDFFGRKAIFFIVVVLLTLSLPGSAHAVYKMLNDLGLRNSYLYLLVTTNGFSSNFLIFMGFWRGVDWAYAEAAYIDGASEWKVLTKIMLPMIAPMMAVCTINGFIGGWLNENPSMLHLPEMPSLGYGLFLYQSKSERSMNFPMFCAVLIFVSIPSMITFALLHEKSIKMMNIGGLKG
jgi:raffinose/stachyose/melibiose transport system permease protein/N-acetylglucosamine transport system permease protein